MTELVKLRQTAKALGAEQGVKVTYMPFIMKATALALAQHPMLNGRLDEATQELVHFSYVDLGIAMDTGNGLIVPVVRDVDRKSIKELSIELNDMVEQTRSRKIPLNDLQGGTFTITNAGAMGGGYFAPIINFPEVAILGMGRGRLQATVIDKGNGEHEIAPRLIMPIVLCIDHRVLDGADAIKFLKVVIDSLEDPDELLISMI